MPTEGRKPTLHSVSTDAEASNCRRGDVLQSKRDASELGKRKGYFTGPHNMHLALRGQSGARKTTYAAINAASRIGTKIGGVSQFFTVGLRTEQWVRICWWLL